MVNVSLKKLMNFISHSPSAEKSSSSLTDWLNFEAGYNQFQLRFPIPSHHR